MSALILILASITGNITAQTSHAWNNKSCAVVLTYDDAIDIDLDNVVPSLDSVGLKGTFYLTGSSSVIEKRMTGWRKAANEGHELGNHSLFHPCAGGPGREFAKGENDLRNYTVERAVREIRATNTLLNAIDGKEQRTFAYPCGDRTIGDVLFYGELAKTFVAARGVTSGMDHLQEVNLDDVHAYFINGQDARYMIDLVDQAMKTNSLIVFLFHGVGGGHALNVGLKEHNTLLRYLKKNEKDIWIASMVDVAQFVRASRTSSK